MDMRERSLGMRLAIVSRGHGRSALARSNYQLGDTPVDCTYVDESTFASTASHRRHWMLTPTNAPPWASDARTVWSAAARAERQWNAQEARILDVQIPRGIPYEWVDELVQEIYDPFVSDGLVAQVDFHVSPARDMGENPHLHGLISTRPMTTSGFARTKIEARRWNRIFRKDDGREMRRQVAAAINAVAERHGCEIRVVAETNEERGRPPAEQLRRRGIFRAPHTDFAKDALAELDAGRQDRQAWEEAAAAEEIAIAERVGVEAQIAALAAKLPSLSPMRGSARFDGEVLLRASWQCMVESHGNVPIEQKFIGEWALAIAYAGADLLIEEDALCIEGEITAHVASFVGAITSAVGWDEVSKRGEMTRSARIRLTRANRSWADPISFHVRRLEQDELFIDLSSRYESAASPEQRVKMFNAFCRQHAISRRTRDVLIDGLTDNWGDGADVGPLTLQIDRAVSELAMISIDQSIKRIISAKVRAHTNADGEEAELSGGARADELSTEALRLLRAERIAESTPPDPQSEVATGPEEDGTGGVGEPIPPPPAEAQGVAVDELKVTFK
ncbi:MobA/MobL family protein [Methylocapsa aurea]|uniref:MobA/MobL family protein n=1 Tax=Methylocapsa aurea TaxID=663610 RepID=UPI003D187EEB